MTRRKIVCGNWKMNMLIGEAEALVDGIKPLVAGLDVDIGVAPPFTALHAVARKLDGTAVRLSAQDCHFEEKGAFTGEVAPSMLRDACCSLVIIGHSERRTLFGETDEMVGKKAAAAVAAQLVPIVCVGETLEERDAGDTLAVVSRQVQAALSQLTAQSAAGLVLAYEPVWAIGTGRTATPEQAQQVHAHLRGELETRFGAAFAQACRIQYGGSMKPGNAAELLAQPDIDGGLIGGASLKPDDFAAICKAAAA